MRVICESVFRIPGFPPIKKLVDHTLDHKVLWFQAEDILDYEWSRVWSTWIHKTFMAQSMVSLGLY